MTFGALVLTLAGCASTDDVFASRITHVDFFSLYHPGEFSTFAAAGPFVEIRGTPPGGATPEEVLAELRIPARWQQTPPRLVSESAERPARLLMLIFGASGAGNPFGRLRRALRWRRDAGRLSVSAGFCINGSPASVAYLVDTRAPEPGDPAFADALARLVGVLSPANDPQRRGLRDGCRLPYCF